GLDERTVAAWQGKAGRHARRFHRRHLEQGHVEAQQVRADELWVKRVARKWWLALALAVPRRLWLGGVCSPRRDGRLRGALAARVKACLKSLAVRVCVAGLAGYVQAFGRAFRPKVPGRIGRPRLEVEPGLRIGQLSKRYRGRRVVAVVRRVARGTAAAIG